MKRTVILMLLALSLSGYSQDLPPVPDKAIELRLEKASAEFEKSADLGELAAFIAFMGAAFIGINYIDDPEGGQDFRMITGASASCLYMGLTFGANHHKRKAAQALHFE